MRFEFNGLPLGFTPDILIKLDVYAGPSDSWGDFAGDQPISHE